MMKNFDKINLVVLIFFLVLGINFLLIPNIKEGIRQYKITDQDITNYINNSIVIKLDSIQIVSFNHNFKYADGTTQGHHAKKKNILLFKDLVAHKYYQTESYGRLSDDFISAIESKSEIYLIVNKQDNINCGTLEHPIISLRYYQNPQSIDCYISNELYYKGVKEYLIYKGYKPTPKKTDMIIGIITLILFGVFFVNLLSVKPKPK